MSEWDPEIDYDEAAVLAAIDEQFPQLDARALGVTKIGAGWDNAVWRVGPDVRSATAFRFAQRARAAQGVLREMRFLASIAIAVPISIPTPTHHGVVTDAVPLPWFGYQLIDGEEVGARELDDTTPLGQQLGAFLRELHEPTLLAVIDPDHELPFDPIMRARIDRYPGRVWDAAAQLQNTATPFTGAETERITELLERVEHARPDRTPCIAHGDLHQRHALVDRRGRLTGVIDWGDFCRAPAFIDFILYWSVLDAPGRAAFRADYGDVDDDGLACARVIAIYISAMLAASAAQVGRPDVADTARRSITRIIADDAG